MTLGTGQTTPMGTTPMTPMGTPTTTGARSTRRSREIGGARETKPFYRTSEFIVFIATAAVVLVAGYSNRDTLDLYRTWQLVSVLAAAYILSRGLAKAGSREGARDTDSYVDVR
jgi:hypothetical protein